MKRRTTTVPIEFDGWIKGIQKKLYIETNEIYNKTQVMKILAKNSKVNVKKKKDDKYEISLGI
ncbi:unnamed protein product [marine sediment metagenome]|uniref:Uncharacterized protein n=1 Tax=marine sediment metagenome TaxID=412755 RepID=X1FP45_9ZZZZ